MVARLEVTGSGKISPDDSGNLSTWTVTESITPVAIGGANAGTGSVSFAGARDETDGQISEWMIDEDATFIHTGDGSASFGEIEGSIQTVNVSGATATGSISTLLKLLNAERTMPTQGTYTQYSGQPTLLRANGTSYQGQFQIPLNMAFDSAGNFFMSEYETGRVIKFSPTGAYLAATASDTPGSGFGTGNGQFNQSAPTYAIAIDATDRVYVTDPGNNRVQRFTNALVYDAQFGSPGTGNGQFSAPTGIAINTATGKIFVVDSLNYRVQRFSGTHVYETKWGSQGTGNSQFSIPRDVALDSSGYVYVTDGMLPYGGRIQKFDANGTFLLLWTMNYYPPAAGSFPYGISVDSLDRVYVAELGSSTVQRFTSSGVFDGAFGSFGTGAGQLRYPRDTVQAPNGDIWVSDGQNQRIVAFTPAPSDFAQPLSTYYQQYVDLCIPGHVIDYQASTDPLAIYPGWTANVWNMLNDLAAATATELWIVDNIITIRDVADNSLSSNVNLTDISISVDSANLARAVDIVYQNVDYGDGVTLYDARLDGNRILSVSAGKSETFSITTNSYPVVVNDPAPVDSIQVGPGQYHVIGSDNLPVASTQWTSYGGKVTVAIGSSPNVIDITLKGPDTEIPGVPGPYYLAASDGQNNYATLNITGSGVSTSPRTLRLYTGANPDVVTQEVQTTITNLHITNEAEAYSRGVWASDLATGPNVSFTATVGLSSDLAGQVFGLFPGSIVDDIPGSKYRVTGVNLQNDSITISGTRHVTSGDETTLWASMATITNYATNPSFETGTLTGFTAGSGTTATQSNTWASSGTQSMRLSATNTSSPFATIGNHSGTAFGGTIPWGMSVNTQYTVSADVHSAFPGGGAWLESGGVIEVTYGTASQNGMLLARSDPLDSLTVDSRPYVTFTIPSDAQGVRIAFYATGIGTNWYAYWDSILLTTGQYHYQYFSGATSGASWTGTANASASTKAPNTAGDYAAFWNGEPAKNAIISPLREPQ